MPRFRTRPALALLCALLCLAACAPAAIGSASPTATMLPTPTVTPTPALAPTPTNVPAGWKVLATLDFSLAYPSNWTLQTYPEHVGAVDYHFAPPSTGAPWVTVSVQELPPEGDLRANYCMPVSDNLQHTTLAGLPMTYMLNYHINGLPLREWEFVNAQRTVFSLEASDVQSSSATQAHDEAILATFRPNNAIPWSC